MTFYGGRARYIDSELNLLAQKKHFNFYINEPTCDVDIERLKVEFKVVGYQVKC